MPPLFADARVQFHADLLASVLSIDSKGVASNADSANRNSCRIAKGIADILKVQAGGARLPGQTSGHGFEDVVTRFVQSTFPQCGALRPGIWDVLHIKGRDTRRIAEFKQYAHLIALDEAAKTNPALAAALGSDYTISPDVIVARQAETDARINYPTPLVDGTTTKLADLRKANDPAPLLHASISCKWTIRSDRVQGARSEALNLMRNRKGRLPHILVVTGEPTPSRLASIALGTGDIDCVYHYALYELQETLSNLALDDAADLLAVMIDGKRLKDISDLPLDLAV